MNYQTILRKAYQLTWHNPVLWVFGLFLSSGFNLNIFYALVSNRSGLIWGAMRQGLVGRPVVVGLSGIGAAIIFLLGNYLKAWFISEAHEYVHPQGEKCALCMKREDRQRWQQRLPSLNMLIKVILASAITVGATLLTATPLNYLLTHNNAIPSLISLTVIATLVIVSALACWNTFTVYYLMLHKQRFGNAARLSLDLLSIRAKQVFEFVFLLLLIYLVVLGVGSALITIAQFNISFFTNWSEFAWPVLSSGKAFAGLLFAIWFAITNTFFNLALLLFFDQLVKPIEKPTPISAAMPQST